MIAEVGDGPHPGAKSSVAGEVKAKVADSPIPKLKLDYAAAVKGDEQQEEEEADVEQKQRQQQHPVKVMEAKGAVAEVVVDETSTFPDSAPPPPSRSS